MTNSEKLAILTHLEVIGNRSIIYMTVGGAMIAISTISNPWAMIPLVVGLIFMLIGSNSYDWKRKKVKELKQLKKDIEYEQAIEKLDLFKEI